MRKITTLLMDAHDIIFGRCTEYLFGDIQNDTYTRNKELNILIFEPPFRVITYTSYSFRDGRFGHHICLISRLKCVRGAPVVQHITVRTCRTFCSKEFSTSHKTGSAFIPSCSAKNRSVLQSVFLTTVHQL